VDAWLDDRLARADGCEDPDELIDLGCDLADAGRLGDAERCFVRAAALGSATAEFDLGNTLKDQQRLVEAAAAYERAIAGGENDAWLNLGQVLEELADEDGAMRAYAGAAKRGDSNGALSLAFMLRERGDNAAAAEQARTAAASGNALAAAVVASWDWDETLDPTLEPALRAGAEFYPSARANLAELLRSTGRAAEARAVLELGAKRGEVEIWLPLGNLYVDELGDVDAAEQAYRTGIAAGDAHCHLNLGLLLAARGDKDGATEQFRLGAAAGDESAARMLRGGPSGS
jgi:tetratricopeptide (TPR) repeat protein